MWPGSNGLHAAILTLAVSHGAICQMSAKRTVAVSVEIGSSTSLAVSTDRLVFDVRSEGASPVSIDFTAAARLPRNSELLLTMEPLSGLPTGVATRLLFMGEGIGTQSGVLAVGRAATVGRWRGSGRRQGRIQVILEAAPAGTHTIRVRFSLTSA